MLLVPFLFQACARVPVKPAPPPFGHQEITRILDQFKEQERLVQTFFSSGRLTVEAQGSESFSNILIVGNKNPLRIKIELTHAWGRPLVHMLINESEIRILSFSEKKYYHGSLGTLDSFKFFPARLNLVQIWALVRAYPSLMNHSRAVSLKGNQITLLNARAESTQILDFYPASSLPRLVSFPARGIAVSFSDFENDNDLKYARKIKLDDPKTETILALKLKQMVFNKAIPKSIFEMKKPGDFELLPLR